MPPGWQKHFADTAERLVNHIAAGEQRRRAFWDRITDGMALNQLWDQFTAETRATYRLYAAEVDSTAFEGPRTMRRTFRIARAVFWALLMKLSPPRRLFLLVALVLVVAAIGSAPNSFVIAPIAALLLLLALELADRVIMKRDLQIAREIQRWLVPSAAPPVPGVEIAFATRPANTVSGDYYDAFVRDSGRLLLAVADVAGKSVPAALLMATIQASLRTLAAQPAALLQLVAWLNRYASAHSLRGARFTTAFLAELDPVTLELDYINAGHNAPFLRRANREMERLEAGGLPLGIMPDAAYECGHVALARGDLLAILTDGVVEAENNLGDQYGEARLLELLKSLPAAGAPDHLERIMKALDQFVGTAPQHDDITALVVQL